VAAASELPAAEPMVTKTPARATVYTRNYGTTSLSERVRFADAQADDAIVVTNVLHRHPYVGGYPLFGPRYGYYAYRPYYYRPYYAVAPYPYAYRPYYYTFGPSVYYSYYPRYATYLAPRYYGCYHW
jgi:hypothetical protein